MGCCTNLDHFYRRVGAAAKIRYYRRLAFASPDGRRGILHSSSLPAPLHFATFFTFFPLLTFAEKRAIARALFTIVRAAGRPPLSADATMLDWLLQQRQPPTAINRFWRVVLVSALNEELDRTDARYSIDVFWKAFLSHRRGYEIGIPAVPLADLYDGCRDFILQQGGEVRTRAAVRALRFSGPRVTGVSLDSGDELFADFYLSAVPHTALLELLPPAVVDREPLFVNLRRLETSPITGVHFWLDRPVLSEPFLTLLDRTTQWIFNKSFLFGGTSFSLSSSSSQYLQLVISASRTLLPMSRQEIIDLCLRELKEFLPAARDARLIKATVIKETAATFSPALGSDRWRPSQKSPIDNLFLAGDWTATGWPATMEGAVRSGYLAAEGILASDGRPQSLLQPDLSIEPLARFLSRG